MEKFSVKKPFTILVAAIIIIAMGVVSLTHLQMDLLPEISLPYVIVVTAYPGASPEKVEDTLTKPLENSVGTISGVENVNSTSSENYSMVQLEFADGTDMNTAMVRVSSALNQIESSLPEGSSTPNIMEISMDMLATMYVAVERDGYDVYQMTDFVNNDVLPYISRQEGVASISTIGLVEKSVLVELNKKKIDALNDRILTKTNESLAEAQDKLDEAKEQVEDAQKKLEDAQSTFGKTMSSAIFSQLDKHAPGIAKNIKKMLKNVEDRLQQIRDSISGLPDAAEKAVQEAQKKVDAAKKTLDSATTASTLATEKVAFANDALTKAQKALEKERARKLRRLQAIQRQEAKDQAKLEKYIEKYKKQYEREQKRAAARKRSQAPSAGGEVPPDTGTGEAPAGSDPLLRDDGALDDRLILGGGSVPGP